MQRRGFEQRRAWLMKHPYRWGDYPPGRDFCHPRLLRDPQVNVSADEPNFVVNSPMNLLTSRDWSLESLLQNKNFKEVPRESASNGTRAVSQALNRHDKSGVPLIIGGWDKHPRWPSDFFERVDEDAPSRVIQARDMHTGQDKEISFSDFIALSRRASQYAQPEEQQRLYGKDLEYPPAWADWLNSGDCIPRRIVPENNRNLLKNAQVETLMVYIGCGDTFTPSHKDPCASTGHNLMCHTENGGSSFWFMTRSSDAPQVNEYFRKLNKVLDHETHITTLEELIQAPFTIYVAEQKLGDLVWVPPRSCHQVVNSGGLTVKLSWSRLTLSGLTAAIYHELPLYRRVCRSETYRVKAILRHTLRAWTAELTSSSGSSTSDQNGRLARVAKDLSEAVEVYEHVLKEEYPPSHMKLPHLPQSQSPVHLLCDFCGCDIFQSFFECRCCIDEPYQDTAPGYGCLICPGCFGDGRSCRCGDMQPTQCQPFSNLLQDRTNAIEALKQYWRANDRDPPLFVTEKSLAESNAGTFRAGCILVERRRQYKKRSACTLPVHCKVCHRSKSFLHHLEQSRLHSVPILLDQKRDTSHISHHHRHRSGKRTYESRLDTYRESEMRGTKMNAEVQMITMANMFRKCQPVNSRFTRPGWYDDDGDQILTWGHNERGVRDLSTPSSEAPETLASSSRGSYASHSSAPSDNAVTKRGKKRKLDCVLISQVRTHPLVHVFNSLAAPGSTKACRTRKRRRDAENSKPSPASCREQRPRKRSRQDLSTEQQTDEFSEFARSLADVITGFCSSEISRHRHDAQTNGPPRQALSSPRSQLTQPVTKEPLPVVEKRPRDDIENLQPTTLQNGRTRTKDARKQVPRMDFNPVRRVCIFNLQLQRTSCEVESQMQLATKEVIEPEVSHNDSAMHERRPIEGGTGAPYRKSPSPQDWELDYVQDDEYREYL